MWNINYYVWKMKDLTFILIAKDSTYELEIVEKTIIEDDENNNIDNYVFYTIAYDRVFTISYLLNKTGKI